jgi:hypothetical protein
MEDFESGVGLNEGLQGCESTRSLVAFLSNIHKSEVSLPSHRRYLISLFQYDFGE